MAKQKEERKRLMGAFAPVGGIKLDELDRQILANLPDEGTKLGKYLPGGSDVVQLRKDVDPSIDTYIYVTRLKLMSGEGYCLPIKTSGHRGRLIWQRTTAGKLAAAPQNGASGESNGSA